MNSVLIKANNEAVYGQVHIPKPTGADQVLVKVHSIPLNPSDIYFIKGMWGIKIAHPFTPGWECSGEVIEAGEGESAQSLVGKRVSYLI